MTGLAITWWGHASTTLEIDGVTVATDPLLSRRLFHLRRATPAPAPGAARADVVLISHLHHDHLHLPSLARFDAEVPVVVPRGAAEVVSGLARHRVVEAAPGERIEVAGLEIDVLAATHDGRRDSFARGPVQVPAMGFRIRRGATSVWYPGDTGPREDFADVGAVDLALVPIGGWGPTLGHEHLDPVEAAAAVTTVGARWALALHYGTFWPVGLRRLKPRNHHHFYITPPSRFRDAVEELLRAGQVVPQVLTPRFGERVTPT